MPSHASTHGAEGWEDENAGLWSLVRSLGGWDNAGPVSGLARDGSLSGSPVTFPERRSSGPGKVSRSSTFLGAGRTPLRGSAGFAPASRASSTKMKLQPPMRKDFQARLGQ